MADRYKNGFVENVEETSQTPIDSLLPLRCGGAGDKTLQENKLHTKLIRTMHSDAAKSAAALSSSNNKATDADAKEATI